MLAFTYIDPPGSGRKVVILFTHDVRTYVCVRLEKSNATRLKQKHVRDNVRLGLVGHWIR